jgi:hypothetical protein
MERRYSASYLFRLFQYAALLNSGDGGKVAPSGLKTSMVFSPFDSLQPEAADRAFIGNILWLPNVDAGDSWLIFGFPPAELAVHPSRKNKYPRGLLHVYADTQAFVAATAEQDVSYSHIENMSWGRLS